MDDNGLQVWKTTSRQECPQCQRLGLIAYMKKRHTELLEEGDLKSAAHVWGEINEFQGNILYHTCRIKNEGIE